MRSGPLAVITVAASVALAVYLLVPGARPARAIVDRVFLTAFVILGVMLAREWVERIAVGRLRGGQRRWAVHKLTGALALLAGAVAVTAFWIEDARAFGLSLGIVGAGVAVALQKPITSLFGLFVVVGNRLFRVGDRIQVGDVKGDVIDIRAFHTTIMEIGEWMETETWTGRVLTIPNYQFLEKNVANYTKDFAFLFDFVTIPVTYDSDWRKAERILEDAVNENTREIQRGAERALDQMSEHYVVNATATGCSTYVTPTDDWIEVRARYVTTPRGRMRVRSRILESALDRLAREPDVKVAREVIRLGAPTRPGKPEADADRPDSTA